MERNNEISIITQPNRADVLFGKGFLGRKMHSGNVKYNKMIEKRKSAFLMARTVHDKIKIAREIVDAVIVAKKGRFLKKMHAADAKEAGVPGDVTAWIVVNEDAAIMEKVVGALRAAWRRNDSSTGKQAAKTTTTTTTTSNRSKNAPKHSDLGISGSFSDDAGGDDESTITPMENASSNAVAAVTTAPPAPATLFQAAMDGDKETIEQLLRQGDATVNEQDENGFTPLMFACYHGHVHTARYLLKKGAATDEYYVDLQDNTGCTALYWAATQARVKVACLLLKHGASVAIANQEGETPASVATGSCNIIDWDSFKDAQMITAEKLSTMVGGNNSNNNKRRKLTPSATGTTDPAVAVKSSTTAGSLSNSVPLSTSTHARNNTISLASATAAATTTSVTNTTTPPPELDSYSSSTPAMEDAKKPTAAYRPSNNTCSSAGDLVAAATITSLMAENASLHNQVAYLQQQLKDSTNSEEIVDLCDDDDDE